MQVKDLEALGVRRIYAVADTPQHRISSGHRRRLDGHAMDRKVNQASRHLFLKMSVCLVAGLIDLSVFGRRTAKCACVYACVREHTCTTRVHVGERLCVCTRVFLPIPCVWTDVRSHLLQTSTTKTWISSRR